MQTIYLDISNKGVYPCVYAKQGDVDRKFLLVVTDNGVPFDCEDKAISVWYDGDSGEGNYTHIGKENAISVTGNKITVSLIQQMLANAGDGVLSVSVSDASGSQIGLWNIDYCVEYKPGVESEKATQYYDAFSQTVADLVAVAKTFTPDKTLSKSGSPADAEETGRQISVERARINNLSTLKEGSTTGDAELADIRVGYNGKEYTAAGVAVREQISDIQQELKQPGYSVELVWTEGKAWNPATGKLTTSANYNCSNIFETVGLPQITNPDVLSNNAAGSNYISLYNGETYVGYWKTNGNYYNPSNTVVEGLAFDRAAFCVNATIDYTQIVVVAPLVSRLSLHEEQIALHDEKIEGLEATVLETTTKVGKKYYLFGDSITYWDNRTGLYGDTLMVAYPSYIRNKLQAEVVNKGVTGQNASEITARLLQTDLTDAYAVTFMSGANDAYDELPIGEVGTFDTTTYIGSIETAIRYVCQNYTSVKFYLLAPLYMHTKDTKPYAEAMQSVAEHYNIPILRWDKLSQFNSYTRLYFLPDGTHPNNAGHERLADSLIPFLRNN